MPYKISRKGNKFAVMNMDTKQIKGMHDTMEKAQKQMRMLYGVENGMMVKSKK